MNIKSIAAILLFAPYASFSAEPTQFEIHAVADAPGASTKEYLLSQRDAQSETVVLDSAVLLDSSALKTAEVTHDQNGKPQIAMTLTESGAERFGEITAAHVGKRLGIVLAGQLQSAPVIQTVITGSSIVISGNFTEPEAADLASKLNKSIQP